MGKAGRYVCVAIPFIFTVLSIIFLLVAALAGVSNKGLYMFEIDLSELSISKDTISSLIGGRNIGDDINNAANKAGDVIDDIGNAFGARDITDQIGDVAGDVAGDVLGGEGGSGSGITPSDLGLHDVYKVSVWGYCSEKKGGEDAQCEKPKMGWADEALDTSFIDDITKALGSDFEIPEEIKSALNTFKTVSKWTQIVFIIALAALGAQLLVGTFSACTRIASCICFLIAGLSTVATVAAAGLSTATAAVIVGALSGSEKMYGAKGSMNTSFLALVWIAVAFAIGAAVFWLVTICCCSPDRSSRRERKHVDNEKGFATASSYEPLQDPNDPYGGHGHGHNAGYYGGSQASHNAPSFYEQPYTSQYPDNRRADMAYEPYSHRM